MPLLLVHVYTVVRQLIMVLNITNKAPLKRAALVPKSKADEPKSVLQELSLQTCQSTLIYREYGSLAVDRLIKTS